MHCRITIGENKTNQLASEFLGSHHCLQMALLKDYFHINSLPSKQPPQRQRFCEAGRMNQPVLVCGVDHPRRQSRALLHRAGSLARLADSPPKEKADPHEWTGPNECAIRSLRLLLLHVYLGV